VPKWLKVTIEPAVIAPGQEATMAVTLDPARRKDYGFMSDALYMKVTTGKETYRRKFTISYILEETGKIVADADAGARITLLPSREVNLEKVTQFQKSDVRFEVQNTGREVLEIHSVKAACACITKVKFPKKLKPGQKGEISVQYNSGKQAGTQYFHIPVYSNDIVEPTIQLGIKVFVGK
jgi:hypothetical protein